MTNMVSYPFNSIRRPDGSYDRAITAEMERKFNKLRYTNGVFLQPSNGLQVIKHDGTTIKVNAGGCHIEGALGYLEEPEDINLTRPNFQKARYDLVVARFDSSKQVRNVDIKIIEGEEIAVNPIVPENTVPVTPDLIKTKNKYDLLLAKVLVYSTGESPATEELDIFIADIRVEKVAPAIPDIVDTEDLYLQYQASLEKYLKTVEDAIDDTLYGELSVRIDELKLQLDAKFDFLKEKTTNNRKKIQNLNLVWADINNPHEPFFDFVSAPNNSVTIPFNGLMVVQCNRASSSGNSKQHVVFHDMTSDVRVAQQYTEDGITSLCVFPVIADHTYKLIHYTNTVSTECRLYPFDLKK